MPLTIANTIDRQEKKGKNLGELIECDISIVIPVYNEAQNISKTLNRIKTNMDETYLAYEIVVVNDGSSDSTCDVVYGEAIHDERIKLISYDRNMGKGYAVKRGVLDCEGDIIMFLDGDLDISPTGIQQYVQELGSCDLVIGSKRHPLSKVKSPLSRRFLSRAFNLIVRASTGIKATDTQSGLKAAKSNELKTIFNMMRTNRFAFDVELLTAAQANNLLLKELPVELEILVGFRYREILVMFWDLLVIGYRHRVKHLYKSNTKIPIRLPTDLKSEPQPK